MPDLRGQLREDLTVAMRERDRETARVLRTVLAAIGNAEAQPPVDQTPISLRSDGPIAGAAHGVGAAEVARRDLDEQAIRDLVEGERNERLASAEDLERRGVLAAADDLRRQAALLGRYLR